MQTFQIVLSRPLSPQIQTYSVRAPTAADALRIAEILRALLDRHDRN